VRGVTDSAGDETVESLVGDDGWFTYDMPPYGADGMSGRVTRDADGRLVITDLYVHGAALTAETLRGISIPRMEARLERYDREAEADPGGRAAAQVRDMAQTDDDGLTIGKLRKRAEYKRGQAREWRDMGFPRSSLRRPDRSDPEGFYQLVSRAYGEYVAETNAPAREIAAEAGVPVTTVHRWIREARRRGFLPPARKGRAG
jgi:hypothetical protein